MNECCFIHVNETTIIFKERKFLSRLVSLNMEKKLAFFTHNRLQYLRHYEKLHCSTISSYLKKKAKIKHLVVETHPVREDKIPGNTYI